MMKPGYRMAALAMVLCAGGAVNASAKEGYLPLPPPAPISINKPPTEAPSAPAATAPSGSQQSPNGEHAPPAVATSPSASNSENPNGRH